MTIFLTNDSSGSIRIDIKALYDGSKLYSKTIAANESVEISNAELKNGGDPGAVFLTVRTPKAKLVWKGPVPLDGTPLVVKPQTKQVFYDTTPLPSLVSQPRLWPFGWFLFALLLIILAVLAGRASRRRLSTV